MTDLQKLVDDLPLNIAVDQIVRQVEGLPTYVRYDVMEGLLRDLPPKRRGQVVSAFFGDHQVGFYPKPKLSEYPWETYCNADGRTCLRLRAPWQDVEAWFRLEPKQVGDRVVWREAHDEKASAGPSEEYFNLYWAKAATERAYDAIAHEATDHPGGAV